MDKPIVKIVKQTNFERTKAMSIDELAEFLYEI